MAKNPWVVKEYGRANRRVVFLIGGWTYRLFYQHIAAIRLARQGFHCINYCYSPEVFSPDYKKTRRELLLIKEDLIKRIKNLEKHGKTDISLFGTSLGSALAVIVANERPEITKLVLNTTATDMAESVWTWNDIKVSFKRELLERNVTLPQLIKEWKPVSPVHNVGNFKGKRVLVYLSVKDRVTPYNLGEELVRVLRSKGVSCQVKYNTRLLHSPAGLVNLIRIKQYLQFLKQS